MFYEAFLQILKLKQISTDCIVLRTINLKFYSQNFPVIYNFGWVFGIVYSLIEENNH